MIENKNITEHVLLQVGDMVDKFTITADFLLACVENFQNHISPDPILLVKEQNNRQTVYGYLADLCLVNSDLIAWVKWTGEIYEGKVRPVIAANWLNKTNKTIYHNVIIQLDLLSYADICLPTKNGAKT